MGAVVGSPSRRHCLVMQLPCHSQWHAFSFLLHLLLIVLVKKAGSDHQGYPTTRGTAALHALGFGMPTSTHQCPTVTPTFLSPPWHSAPCNTFCLADSVGQLRAPSPGHNGALHSCRHMGKKTEPPQHSTRLHCPMVPHCHSGCPGCNPGMCIKPAGHPQLQQIPCSLH